MAGVALVLHACGNKETDFDATGVFEATETTVYAEQNGALMTFGVTEGDTLAAHCEVGLIDTTQIWLKLQQTNATKRVYQSQKPEMQKQIAATRQQLAKALQDRQRYKELVADGAALPFIHIFGNSQHLPFAEEIVKSCFESCIS